MHVLEAGFEVRNRPGVLLIHGFPELAYSRTGFQGGLQGYRGGTSRYASETHTFSGRTIDQPSMFIGGKM